MTPGEIICDALRVANTLFRNVTGYGQFLAVYTSTKGPKVILQYARGRLVFDTTEELCAWINARLEGQPPPPEFHLVTPEPEPLAPISSPS